MIKWFDSREEAAIHYPVGSKVQIHLDDISFEGAIGTTPYMRDEANGNIGKVVDQYNWNGTWIITVEYDTGRCHYHPNWLTLIKEDEDVGWGTVFAGIAAATAVASLLKKATKKHVVEEKVSDEGR